METKTQVSRKEQIIKIAEKLFMEKGFMATSMRDIASELGIEAASLYSHIKSKDEILETICFRMADQFLLAIEDINDVYFDSEEKLRSLVRMHVRILTSDLNASAVFLHEWRHLNEPRLTEFKKLRNRYENEFKTIIRFGEDENIFETVDEKFAVLTILSTLNWITEWYKPEGRMTADEIAKNLSDFIMTGLKKKSILDN
jgi:AcrR family transcriptional regulator